MTAWQTMKDFKTKLKGFISLMDRQSFLFDSLYFSHVFLPSCMAKQLYQNLPHCQINFAKQPVTFCTDTVQLNKLSLSWLYWEVLFSLLSFHYMAPDVSIAVFVVSSCLLWCLTPCGCLWWTCWSAESWKHKLTCVSRLPFGPLVFPILVWKDRALVSH